MPSGCTGSSGLAIFEKVTEPVLVPPSPVAPQLTVTLSPMFMPEPMVKVASLPEMEVCAPLPILYHAEVALVTRAVTVMMSKKLPPLGVKRTAGSAVTLTSIFLAVATPSYSK